MHYLLSAVHVNELDDQDISCLFCDDAITEEAYYVEEFSGNLCEHCVQEYVKECEMEAKVFAAEHCRITKALPAYDDENEFRCTPEEYETGFGVSNTPDAYFVSCRHENTNYDELIWGLSRTAMWDQVLYHAIRDRIDRMLIDEIEEKHPNVHCDWWGDMEPL